jgi:HAMP domain-containing protein/CheY-like chemotaxis protein/signal transduction histidine kinase
MAAKADSTKRASTSNGSTKLNGSTNGATNGTQNGNRNGAARDGAVRDSAGRDGAGRNGTANGRAASTQSAHSTTYTSEQLQPLLHALDAARSGDFSVRMPNVRNGILSDIYRAYNEVIGLNEGMAKEIVRVGRIVGREGRMTERATLKNATGSWADSADSINSLIEDLARPTTEIARVITAVAEGDLTQKMALEIEGTPVKGEFLRIRTTVNTMVDQLSSFAAEVTRVAREVGTEGKLGGQAQVKGVSGVWKDLTDNVNFMATNLTTQVRGIAKVVTAVANGNLKQKLVVEAKGEVAALADTINSMIDTLSIFAEQVTTVAREVGTEGKLGGQAKVPNVAGTWKDLTDNVNFMASNLTNQVRNIALVTTAVANGDLSKQITVDAQGEILKLKNTINTMVDQLSSFASEVTRVAREVGTEGKLGVQAEVKGVSGTWKDLTDNVNGLASNLTVQLRDVSKVATAIANGDLGQKITVDVKGEILQIKDVINQMVDQLNSFAAEVTRVAREVGTEGKLGGQAEVKGVSGVWKDLTDNVNFMASNLTKQVRGIAKVVTAVANGDLGQKLVVEAKGEVAELTETINSMIDTLSIFAEQVTTVAREVGTEGKLGGQADVPNVAGTWKDLTDNVNFMASNLTNQVRNIALVTTAVANGDLSQKITVDVKGEMLELKNTINVMVDQLNSFAAEVTRVAREVGTEGKLGVQAEVKGVSGTWKDLTDNVNGLAGNLTNQVRNIALVTTAVANGDLSQKITVDARGEILELKNTINVMVDQLSSFADEVTRVAKEVGTEGKLGGQAEVKGVSGVWKDLTDNVNGLAGNLTNQVRNIALVTTAVANGDLSKKITVDARGEILELKNTINVMVDQLNSFAAEVTRVAREVGTEGKLGGQAQVTGVSGTWKDLTDNVNFMASNLTTQVRGIVKVVTAVANGDLQQKFVVEAKGEVAALAETINSMIDTLSIFAEQVTTVAREVGTEGILGGQAKVPGVAGTWKDLTDNVNFMASNLTTQVRGIAKVVTAVANGDLKQKLVVEAKGEVAALAETINSMTETLSIFADQVTTVAREVGTEGKLGGQAKVPGVAGTWKDLTDNVNYMANSLTTQVRAISDVATAVAQGDLTRSIEVEAQGEVADLKNNINQMIGNLKATTQLNTEQDWLKTNLARFSRMMQGQKNLESVARLIMSELTPLVSAHHGVFYINEQDNGEPVLKLMDSYAYKERKSVSNRFHLGESLVGQCALEKKSIKLTNVPGDYIRISSGLGEAPPLNIIVLPVLFETEIMAVIELASFHPFSQIHEDFLDQLMESIGVVLNMISANMRTEELLERSQSLAQELQSRSQELQSQQEQLKESNSILEAQARELEERASLLADQNKQVEHKNREVELARTALEEKAEQLALSSKYKSEFLANMSHELRTPLNSMLILAKLLSDNQEHNLTGKQVEFANTIYASGGDLLNLINEILDLSKVESGKMEIEVGDVRLADLKDYVQRTFEPVANGKGLEFSVHIEPGTPEIVRTDVGRLQQVLKNLLSNAFKFTDQGRVALTITRAAASELGDYAGGLSSFNRLVAFRVSDTGIGIARDKQKLIFEAFQQADGTTSRKYGGTGLGLSISREITRLLGGRIAVESEPGLGSTFTLLLPQFYVSPMGDTNGDGSNYVFDTTFTSGDNFSPGSFNDGAGADGALSSFASQTDGADSSSRSATVSFASPTASSHAVEARFTPPASTPSLAPPVAPRSPLAPASPVITPEAGEASAVASAAAETESLPSSLTAPSEVPDDRANVTAGDRVLLIVEDDVHFARILLDMAREKGFKGVVALRGDTALAMAREYKPDAITLDLQLPLIDGWTVLDHLKRDPSTRHIPIQVISVVDRERGATVGAIAYLEKPVSSEALEGAFTHIKGFIDRDVKDLLIVEDDEVQRNSIVEMIGNRDVKTTAVATGEDALAQLKSKHFDCMVLDLGLPDMAGFDLLRRVKRQAKYRDLPVVIYTSRDLTKQEETQLKKYAETIIIKDARSPERLLDETALFLHRVIAKLPEAKRRVIEGRAGDVNGNGLDGSSQSTPQVTPQGPDASTRARRNGTTQDGVAQGSASPNGKSTPKSSASSASNTPMLTGKSSTSEGSIDLSGRKILVVDDDVRNVFALTSVLENYGMNVVFAENGRDAIEMMHENPDIDLVLMDVMMPEMDGYETTQAIRKIERYANLPIIALTAKAMAGDRERSLAAGASDYITKPVDLDMLLDTMRKWVNG